MSEHVPPWFTEQQKSADSDEDYKRRRDALLQELPRLMERQKDRGRANQFLPYLLVRSVLGDRGDRPVNVPFWESPDIWTAAGEPAAAPPVPPDHGGVVNAGQPTTVYAHVWNLGFAPLAGVKVEFYWFDPSVSIDGSHAHLIGVARCELAGRGMAGAHQLVKCPAAWTPVMANGGHECLMVRVSGLGDPIGGNEWKPWLNRHVAQRNISVVAQGANIAHLLASLNATRLVGGRLQLVQVGGREGDLAGRITLPDVRIVDLDTHVLGEIDVSGAIVHRPLEIATPAMHAAVHPLAAGGPRPSPRVRPAEAVHVLDVARLLGDLKLDAREEEHLAARIRTAERATPRGGHLFDLFKHRAADRGHPVRHPNRDQAAVMRVAQYEGDQLVGGYTLVVTGSAG